MKSHPEKNDPAASPKVPASPGRRSFLKTTAGVAAGAAALAPGAMVNAAHVAGRDVIRIGLVGCGGRGTGAATQAMNTAGSTELVAMADVFEDRLNGCYENVKKAHDSKVVVDDDHKFIGLDAYEKVLQSDIDLVILATPPGFRPLHFEKAVEAGKHVFMEKPVATDPAGVRRVLAANEIAKAKSLAVQVGLQRHHESRYQNCIAQLKDGIIGDINFARAYWNSEGVWTRNRQPEQSELEYQMRNWYYFNWLCGDHITEQHIHNIDVINWLFDGFPVKAQGVGGRQVRTGKEHGEIYDHHMVEFTYANGQKMLSQCRHIRGCWNSVSEHAHGSKGYANISAGRIFDTDGKMVWNQRQNENGWQQEHHDLFAKLRQGEFPNEAEYGAKSTMTSILGRMATYTGKEITWDQAFNSNIALADFDSITDLTGEAPVKPNPDMTYNIKQPGQCWDEVVGGEA